jgi:hypothetical protein
MGKAARLKGERRAARLDASVISRSDPGWVRAMEHSSGAMKPGVR